MNEPSWQHDRSTVYGILVIVALILAIVFFAVPAKAAGGGDEATSASSKPNIVEIMELSGDIGDGTVSQFIRQVEQVNDNPRVKAVVLIVNTPGGGALASAAIYEEMAKLKVPVVGWCDNMCASGGMYVLMSPSVKYIGLRKEAIAGSIGVIMRMQRFNRLLDWAKIDSETYKSGSLKDAGNPTRPGQEDERKYLQSIIDDLATSFYAVVAKARPKLTDWSEVKTGKIFIGASAVKVGLADGIMGRDDAIKKAKELSGAKLIFTREELKKMSASADERSTYRAPRIEPTTSFGDVPWLIEALKEIKMGESVRFEYRAPYQF